MSEMALHFIDRYGLMCLKIGSKWELRRLCQATGATALVRLGAPTPDEMGVATSVKVQQLGGKTLTVFQTPDSKLATLVLRASTSSVLQDLERAVDDGVHAFEQLCRDGRVVPGAGATEMALSLKLHQLADVSPGLDQYAIRAFAKALEISSSYIGRYGRFGCHQGGGGFECSSCQWRDYGRCRFGRGYSGFDGYCGLVEYKGVGLYLGCRCGLDRLEGRSNHYE